MSASFITTRPLTKPEKSKMRKTHWFLIPLILMVLLFVIVVNVLGEVPLAIQYAVYGIGGLAVLSYTIKQVILENEIKSGQVEVVCGIIDKKERFGKSRSIGIQNNRHNGSPDTTFVFTIGGKAYQVTPKNYNEFEVTDLVELVWFPRSKHLLSVKHQS